MLKEKPMQSAAGGADVARYLKAPHVGSWMVLVLVAVLLVCGVAWSLIGTIRTSVALVGLNDDGHMVCYVTPAEAVSLTPGLAVAVDGDEVGVVASRGMEAMTREEVAAQVDNAYLVGQLRLNDNNAAVYIDLDPAACPNGVARVDVVLAEMRPFDLLFG